MMLEEIKTYHQAQVVKVDSEEWIGVKWSWGGLS